jgi:hypothetical protein
MEHPEEGLMDPPKFDTLCVQFRGDNHEITLPYCEVANGDILKIDASKIVIALHTINEDGDEDYQEFPMNFKEFVEAVEAQFSIKQITKLSIQKADSYEKIVIL